VFQRIGQEFASNIRAVDVVNSSDAAHFIAWKRNGMAAPFVPEDVAKHFPPEYRDPDGMFATSAIWLSSIAYNTNLVKPEDAPKSFADLLDPKWAGKMVKAHPGYSGTIMTATFQMVRDSAGSIREARQAARHAGAVLDRSAEEAVARRARRDGRRQRIQRRAAEGSRPAGRAVYPTEGTPTIVGPNGIFKAAPNPNAPGPTPSAMIASHCAAYRARP
jgi:iron(III) transport system substrate-binding protein